jgi:hypothetical protein
MGRAVAPLFALAAMLSATGCGGSASKGGDKAEDARMGGEGRSGRDDVYEAAKAKARAKTARLIETSTTYPRPADDPDIYAGGKDNRIAMFDRKTGDFLLTRMADRERFLMDFDYMTRDGELVCTFATQFGGGIAQDWQTYPVRVYAVEEADRPPSEAREGRKCISIKRFAEFLTAFPDFSEGPKHDFVVIDAPRMPGEYL